MDKALATATGKNAGSSRSPVVKAFFHEPTFTASYVVSDPATHRAAIIDSVLDYDAAAARTSFEAADAVIDYAREHDLNVDWLLETHARADHLSAAPYLQKNLGGKIAIGRSILTVQDVFGKLFNADSEFVRDGSQFDCLFDDGDQFQIGDLTVTVLHVPGHTPADVAYVVGGVAFVGDTVFMPDYGTARADFPGGDARVLYRSIRRLLSLPAETKLFLCHDYKAPGRDNFAWETTVGHQRQINIHVHDGVDEETFVAMRQAKDKTLAMPKLILPSIQINMRAGELPPISDNGIRYLQLPMNVL